MNKEEKKTTEYVDDGHTVYNMDGVTRPNAVFPKFKKKVKTEDDVTRKEKNAIIRAAFKAYFPVFLTVLSCFVVAVLLLYLWLN